jgi:hypothetical protein
MSLADLVTRNPRVRFTRRPVPLPPELRSVWRVATVVVLMRIAGTGKAGRVSLRKLHALSWACRSPQTRQAITAQLEGTAAHGGPFVSVDPALNSAIDFAHGEGLVERLANGRLALSESGQRAADEIVESGALAFEAECARQLKPAATERNVAMFLRRARRT